MVDQFELTKIPTPKELEMSIRRRQEDQPALIALFKRLGDSFGHRLDMKYMLDQIENIETQRKAWDAFKEYSKVRMEVEDLPDQREVDRLERESKKTGFKRKIAEDEKAINEIKKPKEPEKSNIEKLKETQIRSLEIETQDIDNELDKHLHLWKRFNEIREDCLKKGKSKKECDKLVEELKTALTQKGLL